MTPKTDTIRKKDEVRYAVRNGREIATVDIFKENYEPLKQLAGEVNEDIKPFTNELLEVVLSAAMGAKLAYPTLKVVKVEGNSAYVEDSKKQEIAKVVMEKGRLKCWVDKTETCDHCSFIRADLLTYSKLAKSG